MDDWSDATWSLMLGEPVVAEVPDDSGDVPRPTSAVAEEPVEDIPPPTSATAEEPVEDVSHPTYATAQEPDQEVAEVAPQTGRRVHKEVPPIIRAQCIKKYYELTGGGMSNRRARTKAGKDVCDVSERTVSRWLKDSTKITEVAETDSARKRMPQEREDSTQTANRKAAMMKAVETQPVGAPNITFTQLKAEVQSASDTFLTPGGLDSTTRKLAKKLGLSLKIPTESKAVPSTPVTRPSA